MRLVIFNFKAEDVSRFGRQDNNVFLGYSLGPLFNFSLPLLGSRVAAAHDQCLFLDLSTDGNAEKSLSRPTRQHDVAAFGYFPIFRLLNDGLEGLRLVFPQLSEGLERYF